MSQFCPDATGKFCKRNFDMQLLLANFYRLKFVTYLFLYEIDIGTLLVRLDINLVSLQIIDLFMSDLW